MDAPHIESVYSYAQAEYTKQLTTCLIPAYFKFYDDLLKKAKEVMVHEPKKVLWHFQTLLDEIHDWNMEKVNTEIDHIHANCGCDYLDDLLTAVFLAHTKVLTAIRISTTNKRVDINVPKVNHFLFKGLCETARLLWSSSYLFRDNISSIEKQQNYRMIEGLIQEGILQAIRSLIPVKSILKDLVMNASQITRDDPDDSDEDLPPVAPSNLPVAPSNLPVAPSNLSVEPPKNVIESPNVSVASENVSVTPSNPSVDLPNVSVTPSKNVIEPPKVSVEPPPTIVIDEKPTVSFGQFNTVFGLDHPDQTQMVYEDGPTRSLDLEIEAGDPEEITMDDYETLE